MKSILLLAFLASLSWAEAKELVIYTSRQEQLLQPLTELYEKETGTKVKIFSGKAGMLLQKILAEGKRTPADLLMTVDAGNLWLASQKGIFAPIDSRVLNEAVPKKYHSDQKDWVGLSLRSRTIVYHKDRVQPKDLVGYNELADEKWKGRLALRTSKKVYNQSLVGMMIEQQGKEKTAQVVKGWVKNQNGPVYSNDTKAMEALLANKADVTLVNTYYLGRMLKENPDLPLRIHWSTDKEQGVHVNVSGAGILKASKNKEEAQKFLEWLVSPTAQKLFAELNLEYPIVNGVEVDPIVKGWGTFQASDFPLYKAGVHQKAAVILMDQAGYK